MELRIRVQLRRLDRERVGARKLPGADRQDSVRGLAFAVWRDHLRRPHHRRLGQEALLNVSAGFSSQSRADSSQTFIVEELFDNLQLCPDFTVPSPTDYNGYVAHVLQALPTDSPINLGLPSNADVALRLHQSDSILQSLSMIQMGRGGSSMGGFIYNQDKVKMIIEDVLERMPTPVDINETMECRLHFIF